MLRAAATRKNKKETSQLFGGPHPMEIMDDYSYL